MKASVNSKKHTSHWFILVLLALAQFMVVLDISIVNVALPTMQRAFSLNTADLQWIITAYSLAFGGFLLLGGRFADYFGRRLVFLTGIGVFTLASLGTGLSQSGTMLIIFRAVQGLAAAFMSPAALSIVLVTYREGHERNTALSVWGAVASGGAATGVLLGGIITQYLNWRWNFFINLPVGIFVIIAALRVLDHHKNETKRVSLDVPGAVSVTGGLMALVYALTEAPTYGWGSLRVLSTLIIGLALISFFIFNESRAKHPLMPLRIFKIRNIAGANSLMILMAAGMFSVFFFTTLYLQNILHYTAIRTGLDFLVMPLVIASVATNVPRVIKRIGYKPILIVAPLFVSGGLFWMSHIPVMGSFWPNVAPGLVLMGMGMGALFVSAIIAATSGVSRHESGLASGLLNTSQQIGGAFGLAILAGVLSSSITNRIHSLHLHTHPSAGQVAAATVHGFHNGFLLASTFGILASLLASLVIRVNKDVTDPSHGENPAATLAH